MITETTFQKDARISLKRLITEIHSTIEHGFITPRCSFIKNPKAKIHFDTLLEETRKNMETANEYIWVTFYRKDFRITVRTGHPFQIRSQEIEAFNKPVIRDDEKFRIYAQEDIAKLWNHAQEFFTEFNQKNR